VDIFDRDDAGIISVELSKGVLEGAGENFLIRHMEDALIDLLGRLAVEGAEDIVGPVSVRGDKAVIAQLVVNILLIGLHAAIFVAHKAVRHRILIDLAVGGDPALAAGTAHQGDAPLPEGRIHSGQHAGVVSRAEVNTHGVPAGPLDRCMSCSKRRMYFTGVADTFSKTLAAASTPSVKAITPTPCSTTEA
jgi:hypothetical protein